MRRIAVLFVLLLAACWNKDLGVAPATTVTPTPPSGYAKSVATVPSIEVYNGWSVTPAAVYPRTSCFTPHNATVDSFKRVTFASTGTCGRALFRISSDPEAQVVECDLLLDGTSFQLRSYQGTDTDCRARRRKDGSIGIVYQLIRAYRPPRAVIVLKNATANSEIQVIGWSTGCGGVFPFTPRTYSLLAGHEEIQHDTNQSCLATPGSQTIIEPEPLGERYTCELGVSYDGTQFHFAIVLQGPRANCTLRHDARRARLVYNIR